MKLSTQKTMLHVASSDLAKPSFAARVSVKAQAFQRIEFFIDGVKYTGAEWVKGKRITLKRKGADIVFEVDGEAVAQIENFYDTEGAVLDDQGWQFSSAEALQLEGDGLKAVLTSAETAGSAGVGVSGSVGVWGGCCSDWCLRSCRQHKR